MGVTLESIIMMLMIIAQPLLDERGRARDIDTMGL